MVRARQASERPTTKTGNKGATGLQRVREQSLVSKTEREAIGVSSIGYVEEEADSEIPTFMKKYTERYPFGNVHMALRFGPLLIENGEKE
jgi:hypothetical protein